MEEDELGENRVKNARQREDVYLEEQIRLADEERIRGMEAKVRNREHEGRIEEPSEVANVPNQSAPEELTKMPENLARTLFIYV